MATRYAVATGDWSNVATWDGGATIPTTGDDVRANGFVVTIDQDINVASIGNDTDLGHTQGGSFVVSTIGVGVTRTCAAKIYAYNACLTVSAVDGTLNWTGDIGDRVAVVSGQRDQVDITGNCDVVWTGDIVGGTVNGGYGLNCTGTGDIIVNGDVHGGPASSTTTAHGIFCNNSAMTLTVNGDVYARQSGSSSQGGCGVYVNSIAVLDINGALYPDPDGFTPTGDMSGATAVAVSGTDGPSSSDVVRVLGPLYTDSNNAFPLNASTWTTPEGNDLQIQVYDDATTPNLLTLAVNPGGDYPAIADVRSGVQYNSLNQTGTLVVPDPASVAYGVSTDDTEGTATLDLGTVMANIAAILAASLTAAE